MFPVNPDNLSKKFNELQVKTKKWHDSPGEKKEELWPAILEDLSPTVRAFPRFRFRADEDSCSEFYLYSFPHLKNLMAKAQQRNSEFEHYIRKSLRMLYYKFHRDKNVSDKKKIRTQAESDFSISSQGHGDLLNHLLIKNPEETRFPAMPDQSGPDEALKQIIERAILTLDETGQALVKLQYGFILSKNEIAILNPKNSREKLREILKLKYRLREVQSRDQKKREDQFQEINELYIRKSHGELNINETRQMQKLQKEYRQVSKGLSVRELAGFLGKTKSSTQRLLEKIQKKLFNFLQEAYYQKERGSSTYGKEVKICPKSK